MFLPLLKGKCPESVSGTEWFKDGFTSASFVIKLSCYNPTMTLENVQYSIDLPLYDHTDCVVSKLNGTLLLKARWQDCPPVHVVSPKDLSCHTTMKLPYGSRITRTRDSVNGIYSDNRWWLDKGHFDLFITLPGGVNIHINGDNLNQSVQARRNHQKTINFTTRKNQGF